MKAIVVRAPGPASVLRLETVPDPTPRPRQIVVQVAQCGVCFHDVVVRNGTLKAGIAMPLILGHEIAGTVVATGADVQGYRVGDQVASTQRAHVCGHCRYCRGGREPLCAESGFLGDRGLSGGYAEYVAVDADAAVPVPDGVAPRDACIASCAIGTALHAVTVGQVAPADTVLVTGASGGVGLHAVQIARAAGASVIANQHLAGARGSAARGRRAPYRAARARRGLLGPDSHADRRGGRGGGHRHGRHAVFQPTRRSLARGGRWVLVGQLTGDFVPFNPAQLFLKGISMLSATSVTREELRRCLHLLVQGTIRAIVNESLSLSQAAEAHRRLEAGTPCGRLTPAPDA